MKFVVVPIALLALLTSHPAAAQDAPSTPDAEAPADERRASEAIAEAGIFGGVRGWKTAYRNSTTLFTYGAFGAWIPSRWFALGGSIEHARRTSSPDELRITNTETLFIVGPRLTLWLNYLRFFIDVGALGAIRTVNYRDTDIASPARFSLGLNVGPGFTVAAAERLGVTVRAAWRRRDDQSHLIGTLDVSWLFQ